MADGPPRLGRLVVEAAVITGSILLAFGLDAWWDGRVARETERELIEALAEEFEAVQVELLRARRVHQARSEAAREFVGMVDSGASFPPADSVWALIVAARRPTMIDPPAGVLRSSINSGTIGLIGDGELRASLAGWEDWVADHRRTEDNIRGYVMDQIIPFHAEAGVHPPLSGPTPEWLARVTPTLRSTAHRGHLWNMAASDGVLRESERLLELVDSIQQLLGEAAAR